MIPTVGRIVHYRLSKQDAEQINVRRSDFRAFEAGHKHPHEPGQPAATGHIAHVGNSASAGDIHPMIIVRVWGQTPDSAVNGQVLLDGNDTLWVTSVSRGDAERRWTWPERADG